MIALVATSLTSGCTVPSYGVAGVGVDADGRIVGHLRLCSHYVDGASLYHDSGADAQDLGSWTPPQRVTDFTSWTLANPPDGWKTDPPLARLRPATEYTLYGWTSDDSSSAVGVTFTLEQLAKLRPGQVMHWSGSDSQGEAIKVESVEEFRLSVCELLR
ncbi:MAG TPA: hypothetical protein VGB75_03645 [Jatrophihabitans sp.]|uniref:hypothetical protein n=1 Tax=Jatrophihabitans sp. TaxID=1932789 RepID=UPI002F04F0E5